MEALQAKHEREEAAMHEAQAAQDLKHEAKMRLDEEKHQHAAMMHERELMAKEAAERVKEEARMEAAYKAEMASFAVHH